MPALVELAKDDYAVLSLPQHGAGLGFAATADFNASAADARTRFAPGQSLTAVVAAPPGPDTGAQQQGASHAAQLFIAPKLLATASQNPLATALKPLQAS